MERTSLTGDGRIRIPLLSIFRRVGCIGDSLASGEMEYDCGGKKGYFDNYDYSWGQYLSRAAGTEVVNYSRGGLTAGQLLEDAEKKNGPVEALNQIFNPRQLCQCYYVALGVNDLLGEGNLEHFYHGEAGAAKTDICPADYRKNKASFVGAYASIIQRLQELQPDTVFFLVNMPKSTDHPKERRFLAQQLDSLSGILPNCFLIDLYRRLPVYDGLFRERYFCGGHMNAMGYRWTAEQILNLTEEQIETHWRNFRLVQYIGSGRKPPEEPDAERL